MSVFFLSVKKSKGSSIVLDSIDCHCLDKNSSNILQNILISYLFCRRKKVRFRQNCRSVSSRRPVLYKDYSTKTEDVQYGKRRGEEWRST